MSSVVRPLTLAPPVRAARIASIDALRGLVMLLMLVDHTREFFYLDHQVSDPMDLSTTSPALFFTRLCAHICAPAFVLLTGLAAWLYGQGNGGRAGAAAFLFKRGLFLVVLELTLVSFVWSFDPLPQTMYLQVIWAIGISMIALAALIHLPPIALLTVAMVLMLGHNLLDGIHFAPGDPGHAVWAMLHDRGFIDLPWGGRARTSYPVLPWIGVIALGYAVGPWFARTVDRSRRARLLVIAGAGSLLAFVTLRAINGYGEPSPWQLGETSLQTAMSFLNLTKYPPSADFLLLTLGLSFLLLAALERAKGRIVGVISILGSVPLFFYLLHLCVLNALNRTVATATGVDGLVSVPNVASLWLIAAAVAVPCWFACRRFAALKRSSGQRWMRYL